MDTSQFELTDAELDEMANFGRAQGSPTPSALYHLFIFDVSSMINI